jgi:AcrR family transcriptional regulator
VCAVERTKPDQIIDTYVDLLVSSGVRQATIEAVARRSGLSKAGLLHHYRSRGELDDALIARLRELVLEDVELMRGAEEGAAHYYLASSLNAESELERLVAAATRLAQAGNRAAGETLRWARDLWNETLEDELGDPVLARLIMLAGDGVSYHYDIADADQPPFVTEQDVAAITHLLERLAAPRGARGE